jgi:hypothetical protein
MESQRLLICRRSNSSGGESSSSGSPKRRRESPPSVATGGGSSGYSADCTSSTAPPSFIDLDGHKKNAVPTVAAQVRVKRRKLEELTQNYDASVASQSLAKGGLSYPTIRETPRILPSPLGEDSRNNVDLVVCKKENKESSFRPPRQSCELSTFDRNYFSLLNGLVKNCASHYKPGTGGAQRPLSTSQKQRNGRSSAGSGSDSGDNSDPTGEINETSTTAPETETESDERSGDSQPSYISMGDALAITHHPRYAYKMTDSTLFRAISFVNTHALPCLFSFAGLSPLPVHRSMSFMRMQRIRK